MLLSGSIAHAQPAPVAMTVGGHEVSLTEFRYFFDRCKDTPAFRQKGFDAFVQSFADYRVQLQAALDAEDDGGSVGTAEPAPQCAGEMLSVPVALAADDGRAVKAAHILVRVGQKASDRQQKAAKLRADSLYRALQQGADFADLARRFSDDAASAACGGELPWLRRGQTTQRLEDALFSARAGEVTGPVLTEFGYHLLRVQEVSQLPVVTGGDKQSAVSPVLPARLWRGEESARRDALLVHEQYRRAVVAPARTDVEGRTAFYEQNKKARKYKGLSADDDLVVSDYQDELERQWTASLRKKYPVVLRREALATLYTTNQ